MSEPDRLVSAAPATTVRPAAPQHDRSAMALHHKVAARAAVGAARLLARQSPARMRAVLMVLRHGAAPATYQQAGRARRDVVAVSRVCAGEGCVPRSLATALLCRARGVWPTWCAGTRTYPFSAHAWVEAQDRLVDEPPGTDRYRVIMRVAAHRPDRAASPTNAEASNARS
ncbi:lasso peptide biosynthesis B2 protein [Streptomyces sp. NPDC000151]|uniref:lasso peptide biosynthesis B2 protein n=1 Tax=Streptomyces sp. NPDC000151 TaxID=3154244 RepID=UPI00332C6E6C